MRLKTQLHQIIGLLAALAFTVMGLLGFWSVRWFHRVEYVEARGVLLASVLARTCVEKIQGPSPVPDLEEALGELLRSRDEPREHLDMISAVVYDADRKVVVKIGATTQEHDPSERHVQEAFAAQDPGAVKIEAGEVFNRFSKDGEEIVEFALPLINDQAEHLGVLVFSLRRVGARSAFLRTVMIMLLGGAVVIGLFWVLLFQMLKGRILAPIEELSGGIERVRHGDLTARVVSYQRDEIGILVESFNDLIAVLVERDSLQARLQEANELEEAHRKLNEAHGQLKAAHEQLLITEKHASIGRLVHGLNHELNNPLSAAQNMIPPLAVALGELRAALDAPAPAPAPAPAEGETPSEGSASDEAAPVPENDEAPKLPALTPGDAKIHENLEDASKAVEVLARSVRRAINIVHDLGGFSRLTTADLETVELQAIVGDALAACEGELGPEGRVAVSVDIPTVEGAPLSLKAFPNLLTQVFVNLLTNSAQAIDGNGKVRVWARLLPESRVRIELDDNGPGIPKENLPKVFEPFFTTKEQGKGTGLGLSLCLGIIQKHGGTIGVKKKWRGAHFVIELPLQPSLQPTTDPFGSARFLSASATVLG